MHAPISPEAPYLQTHTVTINLVVLKAIYQVIHSLTIRVIMSMLAYHTLYEMV